MTPAAYWEARYAGSTRMWSGRVNPVLVEVARRLTPGRALDLGCGEGGDVVWLARQGWRVTGVDLSPTAVARARAACEAHGVDGAAVELAAVDLATWDAPGVYDLVAASFLQSWPVSIPRAEILRRGSRFVAPGGHLLVVAHAAAPPWAERHGVADHRPGPSFPTPESDLADLELDPETWTVLTCETRQRTATGPDGEPAVLVDSVVLALRERVAAPIEP